MNNFTGWEAKTTVATSIHFCPSQRIYANFHLTPESLLLVLLIFSSVISIHGSDHFGYVLMEVNFVTFEWNLFSYAGSNGIGLSF
jgi:hypothetical protein